MNISRFQFEQMQARLARPAAKADPPPERTLHAAIMEYCDTRWPRWKYVHSRFGEKTKNEPGVPDFIIALPTGKTAYVEAKRPGEKLSPAQLAWKLELEKLGHRLHVVYDFNDFLGQLSSYIPGTITTNAHKKK